MTAMPTVQRKAGMTPGELKALVKGCGLTKSDAAAKLVVSRVTLWRWIEGKCPIDLGWAGRIREILKPEN